MGRKRKRGHPAERVEAKDGQEWPERQDVDDGDEEDGEGQRKPAIAGVSRKRGIRIRIGWI